MGGEEKPFGNFVAFDIFPAFNIARVGDAPAFLEKNGEKKVNYFVNSEIPGLWVGGILFHYYSLLMMINNY